MSMTDPVADLLTRIRNASKARKPAVDVPASKLKTEIVRILKRQHFVRDFLELPDNKQGILRVYLRYSRGDVPVIKGLTESSSPGLRKYLDADRVRLSTLNTQGHLDHFDLLRGHDQFRSRQRKGSAAKSCCSCW